MDETGSSINRARQQAVVVSDYGYPVARDMPQGKFPVVRHAQSASGIEVPDSRVVRLSRDLFGGVVAEIITDQDFEVFVTLAGYRFQSARKDVTTLSSGNYNGYFRPN